MVNNTYNKFPITAKTQKIDTEPLSDGRILKSIKFRFPVTIGNGDADEIIPDEEVTVESVVLMSRA